MNLPDTVRKFLAKHKGPYKYRKVQLAGSLAVVVHQAGIDAGAVANTVLLKSGESLLMAIIPVDRELDLENIKELFQRDFEVCSKDEIRERFPDCDPHMLPPLGEAYGLQAIMESRLETLESVYFTAGTAGLLIRAEQPVFAALQEFTWSSRDISRDPQQDEPDEEAAHSDVLQAVQSMREVPPMSDLAVQILQLRNNPYAGVSELCAIIEQDEALAEQVLHYAQTTLFSGNGPVTSLSQAVGEVFGMDLAMDIAFVLALGRSFFMAWSGPLGEDRFWHHAIYCATLTHALCNAMDYERRPPPGMSYMVGMLHNFGYMLLGHLLPDHYERLNTRLEGEIDRDLTAIEYELLGVDHCELGKFLMDAWSMPKEIVEAVRWHHRPQSAVEHGIYAALVYVANALLARRGMGDALSTELAPELLFKLGLDEKQLERILQSVMDNEADLEFMVTRMAA